MPFRERGITTILQIEDYEHDKNPFYNTTGGNIAHMDLDYWIEQIKASIIFAAHLLTPLNSEPRKIYLPVIVDPAQ